VDWTTIHDQEPSNRVNGGSHQTRSHKAEERPGSGWLNYLDRSLSNCVVFISFPIASQGFSAFYYLNQQLTITIRRHTETQRTSRIIHHKKHFVVTSVWRLAFGVRRSCSCSCSKVGLGWRSVGVLRQVRIASAAADWGFSQGASKSSSSSSSTVVVPADLCWNSTLSALSESRTRTKTKRLAGRFLLNQPQG